MLVFSLGLHYWLLNNIYSYLNFNTSFLLFKIILFGILFPLSTVLYNSFDSKFTRTLYWISAIWIGFVIILSSLVLIIKLIELFVFIPVNIKVAILAVGLVRSIYGIFTAKNIRLKTVDVTSDKLKKNLSLVHLSDLHLGAIYGQNRLQKIVNTTNSLKPDFVVITGDLLDGTGKYDDSNLVKPLNDLKVPAYFIFGNHDFYSGENKVLKLLKTTKVKILRSQVTDFKGINIIGIDDSEKKNQAPNELKKIKFNKKKYSILLYHRPKGLKKSSEQGIDLILSGHTHGGQIFPLTKLSGLFNEYSKGLHYYKNTAIIVSQGVDTWGPPMRVGSESQIIQINLQTKQKLKA